MSKVGYKHDFIDRWGEKQTEHILYAEDIGCIINCNSFGEGLNSAKLYGEIEPSGYKYTIGDENKYPDVKRIIDTYNEASSWRIELHETLEDYVNSRIIRSAVPESSSSGPIKVKTGFFYFDFDMREGTIAKLHKLREDQTFGRPSKQWNKKINFYG